MRHRLRVAGGEDPELFDAEALEALHRYSGGTPRVINVLCDGALVYAFSEGQPRVGAEPSQAAEARAGIGLRADPRVEAPAVEPVQGGEERLRDLERRLRRLENADERNQLALRTLGTAVKRLMGTVESSATAWSPCAPAPEIPNPRQTAP